MITLSTFQEYLSSKAPLPPPPDRYIDGQEQQLSKWAALLPLQTEAEQADQIEKVLTELTVAHLNDKLRLKLINIVMTASEQLIATLRKRYIYESGTFTDSQLSDIAQVKSLYYLSILVYDGIVRRHSVSLDYQRKYEPSIGHWKRYFTFIKPPPSTLAVAIYQSLLSYQKLLNEKAICYQKPPPSLWFTLNQLYYLAYQRHIAHIDLSSVVVARHANNIHQLYCQICLHHLLNVYAMQRSSVLLAQRLLPVWADHMVATTEPQTDTRVFVDLHSENSPAYLTAHSTINPYDERHECLFIELVPLVAYLKMRGQVLAADDNEAVVCCLMAKVWMAITYRYIQPPLTMPTKYSTKQRATVITGFNDIHYHVAGSQSLLSLIAVKELSPEQQPRYDTVPNKHALSKALEVETFDSKDALSHFRTLQLLPKPDSDNLAVATKDKPSLQSIAQSTNLMTDADQQMAAIASADNPSPTALPLLRTMSLFLLCRPETDINKNSTTTPSWSIGIVRWLTLDTQKTDQQAVYDQGLDSQNSSSQSIDNQTSKVEWQVLGHELTACALRLDDRSTTRSQHFVPALLVGDDEQLQTTSSLLLPAYHFRSNDRVIMRLGDKQQPLRLQRSLLSTEGFSQYEIVRL
ncbi:hypothetical protein [Psychrobacter sp. 72-O-c]|uniref:hypothetical protein n=1 Tax=Psychrobacter sp. 72-O-c TaxID=2774125 RepID=UPI00191AF655|nr:hypothetical protein [Psychrobacter sp. 72-O-c]